MSPRRSTVTVTDGPSGTSSSLVAASDGGGCPWARVVAERASMAVPLISARRPTVFEAVLCMGILEGDIPAIDVRSQANSRFSPA
jgi:hypothetical protein